MIELTNISKSYGPVVAVREVSLSLPAGDTAVLIGPSGCGKSTLLRILIGLTSPDTGEVRFESRLLDRRAIGAARRRIGYVIQEGGLFPHLTARGNVSLQARYFGWSSGEIEARIAALARLTRLDEGALDRYPARLSGGQRQRVGLMRALMLDPDLLLLDEPLGALDPMIRFDLQEDLKRIFQELGNTVLMVTHDLAEAVHFAGTIFLMNEGRIVQAGSYGDLVCHPSTPFVTRFVSAQRALHGPPGGEAPS